MKKKNLIKVLAVMMIFSGIAFADNSAPANKIENNQVIIEENSAMSADIADYIAQVRRAVKSNWYPPVASFENKATLVVTIDKEGRLVKSYILESSSDEGFDNSLIEASKKAKYKPLPANFLRKSASLALTFEMHRRHITK